MSDGKLSRDERTTPLGLYHFANSYRVAAKVLNDGLTRKLVTHPEDPQAFVLIHSIELYLKAYLRLKGYTLEQLKAEFGHNFSKLMQHYEKAGGHLSNEDRALLELLTPENVFGVRYIVVGAARIATNEGLTPCVDRLHGVVREALKSAGLGLR